MNRRKFFGIVPGMLAAKEIAKNLKESEVNPCLQMPDLPEHIGSQMVSRGANHTWITHYYSDGSKITMKVNPNFDS